jgi:hypothetical protein
LQNHENTSKALIFILRNKSINAWTCHQRDQCRPQVLSLWENPCYITKTLKNHAISLKIKPEILFMIQIPRTSNFSTYYQIKTTPIHETKQAIKIFSKGQLSFGIIIS